jgi:uracil-DNA glycosylase family 4
MKQLDPLVNLWPKGKTMRGSGQDNAALVADAYVAWWQLAGVECAVAEAPLNWLRPAPSEPPKKIASPSAVPKASAPRDLPSFMAWLEQDAGRVERRWPSRPVYPTALADAPLMVVTDMPDPADGEAGMLLADRAGTLFDAMLRAIGLDRSRAHVASLFFARPPGGMVEAGDLEKAAARMRAHVAAARPKRLLLLGDRTARALLPTNGDEAPNSLRGFNHEGGTVPAIATFHPRLLLGQPAAKAECWRALQCLIEEVNP